MAPTFQEVNKEALQPLFAEEIGIEEAYDRASVPFKEFMSKHTRQKDLDLFLTYNQAKTSISGGNPTDYACTCLCFK